MSGDMKLTKSELATYEKLKYKWKELSVEDIILDGLYLNCVRLVKEYTDKILKIDLKVDRINEIGLKSVLQLLADKDLRGAEILLNHMSFDSNQKIFQICFFTLYKQLRDYLVSILIDRRKLNENELEMVDYLRKLEMIYPCRSFQQAKDSIKEYGWKIDAENRNKHFKPSDLISFREEDEEENFIRYQILYSHIVIEWIREWSVDVKQEILVDGLILNREEMNTELQQLNPSVLLSVLLDQNNVKLLLEWIDSSFKPDTDDDDDKASKPIFKSKITQEMVNSLNKNHNFLPESKELVLNYLAKFNVLCDEETTNNTSFQLARLSKSNTLFNPSIFKLKGNEFHSKFILNFGSLLPANFVWSYLDMHSSLLKESSSDLEGILLSKESKELKLLRLFRQKNRTDIMPQLSLINLELVNKTTSCMDLAANKQGIQMSDLFGSAYKERHFVALVLSLYTDDLMSSNDAVELSHLLDEFPAVRLILGLEKNCLKEPVSLYNLLQEHSKLDMTKCFNWQRLNSIDLFQDQISKAKASNSFSGSMLSFENEEFAKRFAYKDSFDYSYFVKKGRPFYAYQFFIRKQLNKFGRTNKTIMEEAKLRNTLILIENFNSPRVVSSCLAFAELLNSDTFKLKLNVYLLKTLNDYYTHRGMDREVSAVKCQQIFVDFFKGDLDAKRLVSVFEQVLVDIMIEKFDVKKMFTMNACSIWLPLMCFCKIHNLPYTCKYLQLCAESNEWLMFLMFAQIYQIPRYQVISSLEYFNDIGLKQHLEYALHNVINSAVSTNDNSKAGREANTAAATKAKVAQQRVAAKKRFGQLEKKCEDSSDEDEKTDYENTPSTENYQISLDSIDFYELLINCQNVADPILQLQLESLRWFTPVLSVFATFYQQHDKISCLCTFLYSSMKLSLSSGKMLKNKSSSKGKSALFDLNDLKDAIQIAASKSYLRTLLNAFKIFIPNTILDIYVDVLYNVFVTKDVTQAKKLYTNYKSEFTRVTLNKHQSYIPLEWYEEVINKLTRILLLKCPTIDDLHNLNDIFPKGNDYCRLIKLVDILKTNKISVNSEDCLDIDDKSDQFNDICLKVIEELLKKQKFDVAEDLAIFCELSKSIFHRIHLARIGHQIDQLRLNNDFEEILRFWKNAHIQLMKIGIKDSDFIEFLKFQNRRSNLMIERIILFNLICQLRPNDQEASKSLWGLLFHFVNDHKKKNELIYLKEFFRKMLVFESVKKNPIKELLEYVIEEGVANDFSDHNKNINEQDKETLNILLYNLVEVGKLKQAYVISKNFKYYNQDLRILLNMTYVCHDMIKPDELDYSLHTFDSNAFKGVRLTNVLRSLSRHTNNPDEIVKDKIEALEKLVGLCNYGDRFSKRIKLDFQLAHTFLNTTFVKVLNENQWDLLKAILYSSGPKKFELARQFSKVYDLNQSKLCDFMLKEVLANLYSYCEMTKIGLPAHNVQLMFDPTSQEEFSSLIKIFKPNSNQFGLNLYEKSRRLLADAKSTDDYIILTELLIMSYNFFSQSCSMEGISNVLRTSKLCAHQLEKAGEFNIMIRLLTGIGHYNEMTYIMDFLWNNHQFEMLFGKGIGKNDKLKLALLDYLKRYHPNDHETYTMVTLNFTMHREIAIMLEEAAYQQLKLLENKTIESTPEILTDLQSILQYFSDAAQSFMKEDCVKQAESCIKKARLIALQVHFLSANNKFVVINLTNAAASRFLIKHNKFWESFIVSEAYEKKSEWPQILFNQFILNNNEKYLDDFKNHIQLTSSMIEEVSNRFKRASGSSTKLSAQSVLNMKKLLKSCLKDIGQFYRIISMLEFQDCVDEMQKDANFSIVSDLISNKKI